MGAGVISPASLVDVERYPVFDLGSDKGRAVVEDARAQLAAVGAAELPGFVTREGVQALVADAEKMAPLAYHSTGIGTAYLEVPDFELADDHPRRWLGPYGVRAVSYDLIPHDSPLRRLYEWDPLKDLIEEIVDRGPVFRYADPFGALNLAVMADGDELQWHFDQTDFVVSLAIQDADEGGDFDVAPLIRTAENERYAEVAAVLAGDGARVVTLPLTPGTLLVFEGRNSLHRVSPIGGPTLRHIGLLAYDTKPGTMGSDVLRMSRYGRTEPFTAPPPA